MGFPLRQAPGAERARHDGSPRSQQPTRPRSSTTRSSTSAIVSRPNTSVDRDRNPSGTRYRHKAYEGSTRVGRAGRRSSQPIGRRHGGWPRRIRSRGPARPAGPPPSALWSPSSAAPGKPKRSVSASSEGGKQRGNSPPALQSLARKSPDGPPGAQNPMSPGQERGVISSAWPDRTHPSGSDVGKPSGWYEGISSACRLRRPFPCSESPPLLCWFWP